MRPQEHPAGSDLGAVIIINEGISGVAIILDYFLVTPPAEINLARPHLAQVVQASMSVGPNASNDQRVMVR
jgi:hypothetical protein